MAFPTFDPGFSTPEMTAIFGAEARIGWMLRFEGELALAQAEVGVIPREAGTAISRICAGLHLDADEVLAGGWEAGTPVIALIEAIRAPLDKETSGWVHFGATTQDIVDTALMLQVKQALQVLEKGLTVIGLRLRDMVLAHRFTPMIARTWLQQAEPTSFGWRAAQWLNAVAHQLEATRQVQPPVVQLGGPVGHLAPLGEKAPQVMEVLARRLGLGVPITSWHSDRSPLIEVMAVVVGVSSTMAKIAIDLALLAQTEIGEVKIRPGGSSSMPHKQNPIDPARALAAAQMTSAVAQAITASTPHQLDRGLGGWHAELLAAPLAFHTAGAAVAAMVRCFESLQIDVARMRDNLGSRDPTAAVASSQAFIDRVLNNYEESHKRSGHRAAIGN